MKACARLFSWMLLQTLFSSPPMRRFNLQTESKVDTKKGFSLTNLSCQKNPSCLILPPCRCLPAFPSMTYFLWGMHPCLTKQTQAPPLFPLCSFTSVLQLLLLSVSFSSPPAGSCLRCHLCTASFVVLVGLQIMCQVLTVKGSLLPSLLSAKHK